MAIESKLARGYAWRMIIIAVVCAVLGLWGVYDYAVAIPRDQFLHDRLELLQLCKDALQTEQARRQLTPEAQRACEAISSELTAIVEREMVEVEQSEGLANLQDKLNALGEQIKTGPDAEWIQLLTVILNGLIAERRLPLTQEDYPAAHMAFETTEAAIQMIGEVAAPGKYDRITQWAFILCLPCVPYFLVLYVSANRRTYRLDDDGTLHMPEGTWTAQEIDDIDMSRWMAKSVAWVVHTDGTRIKLDDYKYKDLHLIIGAIAHRLHPDDWDAEARPVDTEGDRDEAAAESDAEEGTLHQA